jgi:hypothetical protein
LLIFARSTSSLWIRLPDKVDAKQAGCVFLSGGVYSEDEDSKCSMKGWDQGEKLFPSGVMEKIFGIRLWARLV